jgi:hypothetical protein
MRKPILFSKSALLLIALCLPIVAVAPEQSRAANLTSLVSFNGTNGEGPLAGLIADANGNLFGATEGGGAYEYGTVFEIAKTAGGYASTPTTLVSFNGTNGAYPYYTTLIADANGNLFGTTLEGGVWRRHGVRDRQDRRRLCQHPDHLGQLQRHQRQASGRRPDRRRQRQPLRHDKPRCGE